MIVSCLATKYVLSPKPLPVYIWYILRCIWYVRALLSHSMSFQETCKLVTRVVLFKDDYRVCIDDSYAV